MQMVAIKKVQLLLIWLAVIFILAASEPVGQNECASYTINHNYPANLNGEEITTIRGEQGYPGKQGAKGEKGERGYKGEMGFSTQLTQTDIPKSCSHMHHAHSGVYLISPNLDLVQPFYVFCNFSNILKSVTEIGNNFLNEVPVKSCSTAKCAHDVVEYSATLRQIVSLIEVSLHCRQFIKVRCIASVLFHKGDLWGSWISRGGTDMHYWGGATSHRNRFCACGETDSCVDPTKKCNCDKNSSPETSDEGYITDKNNLPVMGFKHGDTDDASEFAWHTLGRLECSGIV